MNADLNQAGLRSVLLCVLLLVVFPSPRGHDQARRKEEMKSLCDMLQLPDQFSNRQVTFRAFYRVAHEASEIYSPDCVDRPRMWVEFDSQEGGEKAAKDITRMISSQGTVEGIFTGIFRASGSYGHLGSYRYELSVSTVKHLKVVDHAGLPPKR